MRNRLSAQLGRWAMSDDKRDLDMAIAKLIDREPEAQGAHDRAAAVRPRARCAGRHQHPDHPRLLPSAAEALPPRSGRGARLRGAWTKPMPTPSCCAKLRTTRSQALAGADACAVTLAARRRWPLVAGKVSRSPNTTELMKKRADARSAPGCCRVLGDEKGLAQECARLAAALGAASDCERRRLRFSLLTRTKPSTALALRAAARALSKAEKADRKSAARQDAFRSGSMPPSERPGRRSPRPIARVFFTKHGQALRKTLADQGRDQGHAGSIDAIVLHPESDRLTAAH